MATPVPRLAPRPRRVRGRWPALARRAWIAILVGAAGLIAGSQLAAPNKRVIQVVAALVLITGALRVETFVGLLILIPLLPFPKATVFGSTTVAFVYFLFIIWLARVVLRVEKPAGRSPIDLPVGLLLCAYLLSFSQIDDVTILRFALTNLFYAANFVAICYLVVQLVQREDQLRRVAGALVAMTALIQLAAVFELFNPATPLVPGWIELSADRNVQYVREGLEITNLRIGGPFVDYELLAEFCAMMLIFYWFLLTQSRTVWQRVGIVSLQALNVFVLLATVTRGALFSLAAAGVYLLWAARRHLQFHVVVIVAAGALAGSWFLFDVVTRHTRSGNIVDRLIGTEFRGLVPDSRQTVWKQAWERVWESPVFGHGPYYSFGGGVEIFYWPHNNYLFYWYMLGILGLGAFLFLLWKLFEATRHHGGRFGHASYARGLSLALRGMLILFIIDQIKIDYIRNPTYSYWVWLFFGLVVAAGRIAERDRERLDRATEPTLRSRPGTTRRATRLIRIAPRSRVLP